MSSSILNNEEFFVEFDGEFVVDMTRTDPEPDLHSDLIKIVRDWIRNDGTTRYVYGPMSDWNVSVALATVPFIIFRSKSLISVYL